MIFLPFIFGRNITSRDRTKSAPYSGLKIVKGFQSAKYSLLPYPNEETIFRIFFGFVEESAPISLDSVTKYLP